MKPFAAIPGVTYPPDSAPEAKIEPRAPKPPRRYTPRRVASHTVRVDGRNLSAFWLKRNGLCVRVIGGVKTVVVDR